MAYAISLIILAIPLIALLVLFVFLGFRKWIALLMVFLTIPVAVGAFALAGLLDMPIFITTIPAFILLQLGVFDFLEKRKLNESPTGEQADIRERAEKLVREEARTRRVKVIYVLIAICLINGVRGLDPLRRSPEAIREYVLRRTSIGMSVEEVTQVINRNIRWDWRDWVDGTVIPSGMRVGDLNSNSPYRELRNLPNYDRYTMIGEKRFGTVLGGFRAFPFSDRIEVDATWIFDAEGKLIDVSVRQHVPK